MKLPVKAAIVIAALAGGGDCRAQSQAATPPTARSTFTPVPASPANAPLYQDLDLLRRDGFASAREATISLRITDKSGLMPTDLHGPDFSLIVNGTPRSARLHSPNSKTTIVRPMVLIVLPPNQPMVHSIAVKEAMAYFSSQPDEVLPWRVGIFDSNGQLFPFTNGRAQLLADLDEIAHAAEPFQRTSSPGPFRSTRWSGRWFDKSQDAIADMQRFDGPKAIVAVNPLIEPTYGELEFALAYDPPAVLTDIARHIGAHIYVANVGGPDTAAAGGGAAQEAYYTSQMMQTATNTLGGFSNSFKDLAGCMHRDLDGNYSIDFDLTSEDRDRGIPSVQVKAHRRELKTAVLDVVPVGFAVDNDREIASREVMNMLRSATGQPRSSPDFRITQHVDFFPLRAGLEPVLPMTCVVEWKGGGDGPRQISVAESLEDLTLSNVVLEREIHARWDRRTLSWERDGRLRPGDYLWRVVVHDGAGKVYSSAQEKVKIGFPEQTTVGVSSLILGKSCRDGGEQSSGLTRRPAPGLKSRSQVEQAHLQIDPMRAADCRLNPDATGRFAADDTLHAFIRLYPSEKVDKHKPESWTAKFMLRSASGSVEGEEDLPFTIDSGSGYLASIQMPLNGPGISPGPHTVEIEVNGPGIRKQLKQSRTILIQPAMAP